MDLEITWFEGLVMVVTMLFTLWAQNYLLRRSHSSNHLHNVVRVSAMMLWLARLMVAAGVVLLVLAFFQNENMDYLAALVLAVIFGGLGSALLYVGKTWFVAVEGTLVSYNRGIGATRQFGFADIVKHEFKVINSMQHIRVKTYNGWSVDIPIERLDASHLLDWLAFKDEHPNWSVADAWYQWLLESPDVAAVDW